jgi:hypothetical protein
MQMKWYLIAGLKQLLRMTWRLSLKYLSFVPAARVSKGRAKMRLFKFEGFSQLRGSDNR